MANFNMLKIAASTFAVGSIIATAATAGDSVSAASKAELAQMMQVASSAAAIAKSALASGKAAVAVRHAEKAVAAMPRDTGYRLLLGESYFKAGRFASAETSFSDVLTLDASNGSAALKLALSQIAQGKQNEALATLETYRGNMVASDYGLALALAGDHANAISTLTSLARSPDATGKIRQNLAFAHAMANNWVMARTIASQDLSGEQVHQRISQWAILARPQTAADQVAGLLGITPSVDTGQPVALALNASEAAPVALASAEAPVTAAEVQASAPAVTVALADAPAPGALEVAAVPAAIVDRVAAVEGVANSNRVVFGPRQEIVQRIPEGTKRDAQLIRALRTPTKQAIVATARKADATSPAPSRALEAGKFAVQLGAYSSARGAEQGWSRLANKVAVLKEHDPKTARVNIKSTSLFRLSVTGFSNREDAGRVCANIKAAGAECFIRSVAGDAPLQWALRKSTGGTRLASARR